MLTTRTATTWTNPTFVSHKQVSKATLSPNQHLTVGSSPLPYQTRPGSLPQVSSSPPWSIFDQISPSRHDVSSPSSNPPSTIPPHTVGSSPIPCRVGSSPSIVQPRILDGIVMVPFFRIPDQESQSYRYSCAAKYLGFYQIADNRVQ